LDSILRFCKYLPENAIPNKLAMVPLQRSE
jgi:hypothetical protein